MVRTLNVQLVRWMVECAKALPTRTRSTGCVRTCRVVILSLWRSTGRSGTHYLSELLATAPSVVAFHEASPTLSGHDTLMAAAAAPEKSYGKRRHKAEAILRSARWYQSQKGVDKLTYVDTSHLFLKAFSDVVMVSWSARSDTNSTSLQNACVAAPPPIRVVKSID